MSAWVDFWLMTEVADQNVVADHLYGGFDVQWNSWHSLLSGCFFRGCFGGRLELHLSSYLQFLWLLIYARILKLLPLYRTV